MALNIKDAQTDQLVRQLADLTGETLTEAVKVAVRERIERVRNEASVADLLAIATRITARIDRDGRTADEIIGYDERGLPQ